MLPDGPRIAIAVFVSGSPADDAARDGIIATVAPDLSHLLVRCRTVGPDQGNIQ